MVLGLGVTLNNAFAHIWKSQKSNLFFQGEEIKNFMSIAKSY